MTRHVFLAYAYEDGGPAVAQLAAALRDVDLPVWYDSEPPSETRWTTVVGEQIRTSGIIVLVATPWTSASAWLTRQIALARELGKPILEIPAAHAATAGPALRAQIRALLDVAPGTAPTPTAPVVTSPVNQPPTALTRPPLDTPPVPPAAAPAWPPPTAGTAPTAGPAPTTLGTVPPRPPRSRRRLMAVIAGAVAVAALATAGAIVLLSRPGPATEPTVVHVLAGGPPLRWSPDGTRIVTLDEDAGSTLRIWDAATGQPAQTLQSDIERVDQLEWSADGSRLTVRNFDSGGTTTAEIWDAASGAKIDTHVVNADEGRLVWSPDGTYVLGIYLDPSAEDPSRRATRIVEAATGATVLEIPGTFGIAWSPDGTRIATVRVDFSDDEPTSTVELWNASTGTPIHGLIFPGRVRDVAWSPDGTRIATINHFDRSENITRVWDATTGTHISTLRSNPAWDTDMDVVQYAWSPDSTRFWITALSSRQGIEVWDTTTGEQTVSLTTSDFANSYLSYPSWSPDGSTFAVTALGDGVFTTRIVDATTGATRLTFPGDATAWSPDGTHIAGSYHDARDETYHNKTLIWRLPAA